MASTEKQYSFKSVGKTSRDVLDEPGRRTKNELPIGFRTPLQFQGVHDGLFLMHTELINQISDNLKNLILTNSGERLIQSKLGANILPLAFELSNTDVDNEIMTRIKGSVASFMPYVNLINFKPFKVPSSEPQHVAKLGFVLTFSVPSVSDDVKAIEIFLNTVG